jgi:drug/metabolite transporter (DMT)-like permease
MRPAFILIAGVAAVGFGAPMARVGIGAGLTSLQLGLGRLTAAVVFLAIYRLLRQAPANRLNRRQALSLIGAGVCLAAHFGTWFLSLEYLPVAQSTLLVSTTPLWAGIVGLFVPSLRPNRRFWLGLVVAFLGMALVTAHNSPDAALKSPAWFGDLMAILGAVALVPALLLSQRVQKEIETEQAIAWIYASAAVCFVLLAAIQGQLTLPPSPPAWGAVIGMALIAQLGGHTIFNWALRHFTAGQVSTAMLLEPVFAGALAWIVFGEGLTLLQGFGGFVLLAGVAITLIKKEVSETSIPPSIP